MRSWRARQVVGDPKSMGIGIHASRSSLHNYAWQSDLRNAFAACRAVAPGGGEFGIKASGAEPGQHDAGELRWAGFMHTVAGRDGHQLTCRDASGGRCQLVLRNVAFRAAADQ